MDVFLRVLKEIGIALVLLLVVLAVVAFAFYDKVPFGVVVPDSVSYTSIEQSDYVVSGNLENVTADTKVYNSTSSDLQLMETEKIVVPGSAHPFQNVSSETDLPFEKVAE